MTNTLHERKIDLSHLKAIRCDKTAVNTGHIGGVIRSLELHKSQPLQWFVSDVESRTQGWRPRPRPRTQKKSEAKAKDSLFEDRHSRGQGQECSRPRPRTKDTSASALQKKKKSLYKNFSSDLHKKTFSKKFFKRSTKF